MESKNALPPQWYYSKNNKQQGPVSAEQLKQLAASGQLQPSDLVWKEGMGQWVEASRIKGLFVAPAAPPLPTSPPPVENPSPTQTVTGWKPPFKLPLGFYSWPAVAALVLFCFPFGLYLVWTHPTWTRRSKVIWSAAWLLLILVVNASQHGQVGTHDTSHTQTRPSSTQVQVQAEQRHDINHAIPFAEFAIWGKNSGIPPQAIQGDEFIRVPPSAKLLSDVVLDQSFLPANPIPKKHVERKVVRFGDFWVWSVSNVEFPSPDTITNQMTVFWAYRGGTGNEKECEGQEPSVDRRRVSDGYIYITHTLPGGENSSDEFCWMPVLKLGAKKGDHWESQDKTEVMRCTYEVVEIFEIEGETIALVKTQGSSQLANGLLHFNTMTWYCRGFGVAREQLFNDLGNSEHLDFRYAFTREPKQSQ